MHFLFRQRGPLYNDECALAKVKYHTRADHCANGTITKSQWLTLMGYWAIVQPTTRQSRWEIPPKKWSFECFIANMTPLSVLIALVGYD